MPDWGVLIFSRDGVLILYLPLRSADDIFLFPPSAVSRSYEAVYGVVGLLAVPPANPLLGLSTVWLRAAPTLSSLWSGRREGVPEEGRLMCASSLTRPLLSIRPPPDEPDFQNSRGESGTKLSLPSLHTVSHVIYTSFDLCLQSSGFHKSSTRGMSRRRAHRFYFSTTTI